MCDSLFPVNLVIFGLSVAVSLYFFIRAYGLNNDAEKELVQTLIEGSELFEEDLAGTEKRFNESATRVGMSGFERRKTLKRLRSQWTLKKGNQP